MKGKILVAIVLLVSLLSLPSSVQYKPIKKTPKSSSTATLVTRTNTPTITSTKTITSTITQTRTPTLTPIVIVTTPVGSNLPYPSAPVCPSHDPTKWHSLWDSVRRCHYDHEHGQNPFTSQIVSAFPSFDLYALLGNVEIGHTNPSSPMENTHKHGGMKWQVDFVPCATGFESATYGVNAVTIQYHAFGDYSIEFETRIHSALAMVRQCVPGSSDYGYIYTVQHQDYGQRLFAYQGLNMPYPDAPIPYPVGLGPYFTNQCIFCNAKYDTRIAILDSNGNVATTWTSKGGHVPQQSVFNLLFRARDDYQVVDQRDQTYPFTYLWMCSLDNGESFSPVSNCRYNNSTTRVHEVKLVIPTAWDGLSGFDTDSRIGRVTGEGFVNKSGNINPGCLVPNEDCFPIKLVSAYVGHTGATLQPDKTQQFTHIGLPERDIYFCGLVVCTETSPNAVPSGWIGSEN